MAQDTRPPAWAGIATACAICEKANKRSLCGFSHCRFFDDYWAARKKQEPRSHTLSGRSSWATWFGLTFAINDASAIEIVGTDFHDNTVTRNDLDEVSTHLAGNVSHYFVAVFQHNTKLSIRQCFDDFAFDLNWFFFGHFFL